jgi:hypothetical protein
MAQAKIRIFPGTRAGHHSAPTYTLRQKKAATFRQGAPVKIGADSGSSSVASFTVPTTVNSGASSLVQFVAAASTGNVVGFAAGNAKPSSTGDIVVNRIAEGVSFVGNLVHPTPASAVATAANIGATAYLARIVASVSASSADAVGNNWGFTLYTTSVSSTSNLVRGKITRLVDPASTVNGRVEVEITNGGLFREDA